MRASTFRRLLNLWPPFLFNSIRLLSLDDGYTEARVVLRLRPWNRNYVRTQFGGNLFAMADPFWMLLVLHHLGKDHFVWDKAGTIDFVAPGREDVYAHFKLEKACWTNCAPPPRMVKRYCAGSTYRSRRRRATWWL